MKTDKRQELQDLKINESETLRENQCLIFVFRYVKIAIVNSEVVDPEEYLSGNIYYYDRHRKELRIYNEFEG